MHSIDINKGVELYTDGSATGVGRNKGGVRAAWAYIVASQGEVLYHASGECESGEGSNDAEHLAIIYGLRSLPEGTRVHLVTDRDDVVETLNMSLDAVKQLKNQIEQKEDHQPKSHSKRRGRLRRYEIYNLIADYDSSYEVIRSGGRPLHKLVDTLARETIGLGPKAGSKSKTARKKREKLPAETLEPGILWSCVG